MAQTIPIALTPPCTPQYHEDKGEKLLKFLPIIRVGFCETLSMIEQMTKNWQEKWTDAMNKDGVFLLHLAKGNTKSTDI